MSTPSEQLRQASETLRRLADGATGNRWNVHPDYLNEIVAVVQGDELDLVLPVSDTIKQADAALIALMDPTLAGLVADWLDVERVECDALAMHRHNDGSGIPLRDAEREVYRNHPALALAEHINGRTE